MLGIAVDLLHDHLGGHCADHGLGVGLGIDFDVCFGAADVVDFAGEAIPDAGLKFSVLIKGLNYDLNYVVGGLRWSSLFFIGLAQMKEDCAEENL